jgi:hypothetical protein
MALHVQVRLLARQLAGQLELPLAGTGGETRRDRVGQPPLAVPARGKFPAVLQPLVAPVAQLRRAVAVHQALARHEAHVARMRLGEQRLDRLRMHGAEHAGAGGAVGRQLVEEKAGRLVADRRIGEARLGRIGVLASASRAARSPARQ